jgi:hypothetical protein
MLSAARPTEAMRKAELDPVPMTSTILSLLNGDATEEYTSRRRAAGRSRLARAMTISSNDHGGA